LTADADNATNIRKKDKADYDATHADLSEYIDAVERAIDTLKSREAEAPQPLMQVASIKNLPSDSRDTIESLLSTKQAPEANAYENQSGGVIKMLEKLRLKFQDELLALQKAKFVTKSNYETLMQRPTDNMKELKKAKEKYRKIEGICAPIVSKYYGGGGDGNDGDTVKFTVERTDLEKIDMNGKHAYDMLIQDLTADRD